MIELSSSQQTEVKRSFIAMAPQGGRPLRLVMKLTRAKRESLVGDPNDAIPFAGGLEPGCDAPTSQVEIDEVPPARIAARRPGRGAGRWPAPGGLRDPSVDDGEETLCALAQGTVVAAAR